MIRPLGIGGTCLLFGGAGLLLFAATRVLVPFVSARTILEPVLVWFLVGGLGVFAPLVAIGLVMLVQEDALASAGWWRERLRFRRMTTIDWLWSLIGLGMIGLLSGGTLAIWKLAGGDVNLHPAFMRLEPLTPERYWILAVWLPFWVLNVGGEEFLWRGVVLPRQQAALGSCAWLANGAGWFLFHLAFGTAILLVLWPVLFVLPYLAQKQQNSWIGVVIHGAINGPGFLAVALGLI